MSGIVLQPIDYSQLTKIQKLSLFMIVIGPEAAARLLKNFQDNDIELICKEISNYKIIDRDIQSKVVNEFTEIIVESQGAILGGSVFVQKALELAKGDFKAANLLGRISPVGSSLEVIKEISDMEPRQIYNLIRNEQAQTIAFIISYLNLDKGVVVTTKTGPLEKLVWVT